MLVCLLQVACLGVAEKRKDLLGVLYDGFVRHVCLCDASRANFVNFCFPRQHWEEVSAKKHSFHVEDQIGEINDTALRRARALHDTFFGLPATESTHSVRQPLQEVRNHVFGCCVMRCMF